MFDFFFYAEINIKICLHGLFIYVDDEHSHPFDVYILLN